MGRKRGKLGKYWGLFLQSARLEAMDRLDEWPAFLIIAIGAVLQIAVTTLFFGILYRQNAAIGGWTGGEMSILLGTYFLIDSVAWASYIRGCNRTARAVENGDMDVFLCRPVHLQTLMAFRYVDVIFVWPQIAAAVLQIAYGVRAIGTPPHWFTYALFLACGFAVHYSVVAMIAAINFWSLLQRTTFLQGEIFHLGRFPMGIYRGIVRFLLSFVIPVAFAFNVPARALIGTLTPREAALAPLFAILFFFIASAMWRAGLKRYESALG